MLQYVPASVLLPPGFREIDYEVVIGERDSHTFERDLFDSFSVRTRDGHAVLDSAGYVATPGWRDTSACTEQIGNYPSLVQATRGSGTIFTGRREWPSYDVYVAIQLAPERYLSFDGGSATRPGQDTLLAIARTVRVRP